MIPFGVRPDFELKASLAQVSVHAETSFFVQADVFIQALKSQPMR